MKAHTSMATAFAAVLFAVLGAIGSSQAEVVTTQLVAGGYHTCARRSPGNDSLWCWGEESFTQQGSGTATPAVTTPQQRIASSVVSIAEMGLSMHTVVQLEDGEFYCAGQNGGGQCGSGVATPDPTPTFTKAIMFAPSVNTVKTGGTFTLVRNATGALTCFGASSNGQCGTFNASVPRGNLLAPTNVTFFAPGMFHSLWIEGGVTKAIGKNTYRQLGMGAGPCCGSDQAVPVIVQGLPDTPTALAAGEDHSCAITASSSLYCWGYNGNGELGIGSTSTPVHTATQATGLWSTVSDLSLGWGFTCIVLANHEAVCAGKNTAGQLGLTGIGNRLTFVQTNAIHTQAQAVRVGNSHGCLLTLGNDVACWGSSADGQVGNGQTGVSHPLSLITPGPTVSPTLMMSPTVSPTISGCTSLSGSIINGVLVLATLRALA